MRLEDTLQVTFMTKSEAEQFFRDVGRRIASARKELNLTQAQLADKLGVKQQAIASYEVGRRRVPLAFLVKLAEALYVEVTDLLPLQSNPQKKRGPIPRLQREIEKVRELPQSKQKLVLDLLETILKSDSGRGSSG